MFVVLLVLTLFFLQAMPLSRAQHCWLRCFVENLDFFKALSRNGGHKDVLALFKARFDDAAAFLKVLQREKGMLCWAGVGYVLC